MTRRLNEPYAFKVYAQNSINFGILVNYRQEWKPLDFQVGDLISTIPLAPKENRKYSKKVIVKKAGRKRKWKTLFGLLSQIQVIHPDIESEIVNKALKKTNFQFNAEAGGGMKGIFNVKASTEYASETESQSAQTKRDFREALLKRLKNISRNISWR